MRRSSIMTSLVIVSGVVMTLADANALDLI
jgi:hypothetical protein